jgi:hypothetical protein
MLPVYHTQYASFAVLQVGDFEHEAVPAGHHFAAPEVRFSQLLSFTYTHICIMAVTTASDHLINQLGSTDLASRLRASCCVHAFW